MKIKNKIAVTLLPLVLVLVLVMNLSFGWFYRKTITDQEQNQMNSARINVSSYINEQVKHLSNLSYDWGHSNDTYNFVSSRNSSYITVNMAESVFHNLSISFNTISNNDGAFVYTQCYSVADVMFTNFPNGFFDDLKILMNKAVPAGNTSGIVKLGDKFYFISTTQIVDSEETKPSNGRIIVGREIDQDIISGIEEITGCKFISITSADAGSDKKRGVVLSDSRLSEAGKARYLSLTYTDPNGFKSPVKLSLSMPRDKYVALDKEMHLFTVLSMAGSTICALLLFLILSRYLSKPISQIVDDIRSIDMTKIESTRLPETGHNEFSFLRRSINMLLARIEIDQKKLFSNKEELEFLSYHDQLTGLYNRRCFEDKLHLVDTPDNLPLSIVYADVNGLKIINDAFGHASGDRIIQEAAGILSSVCRPTDVIARVGGDEFVLLFPKTDENDAEQIITLLKEKTTHFNYMNIAISVSFGLGIKHEKDQVTSDILRIAEDAMYQTKMFSNTTKRNDIIKSILRTLIQKCPREETHSIRVSSLCESIGQACCLTTDDVHELGIAGELHDIGKIAIDASILNKPDRLSNSEWSQIKHHPEIGFRLLKASNEFGNIAEYVLEHHEKWDGTGYPKGLKGEEIHWKARVISIADSYDAMTYDRPYRKALDIVSAAEEIKAHAGTQFDPGLARIFVEKVLKLEW